MCGKSVFEVVNMVRVGVLPELEVAIADQVAFCLDWGEGFLLRCCWANFIFVRNSSLSRRSGSILQRLGFVIIGCIGRFEKLLADQV